MNVYSTLLKKHGILPSQIDGENITDFFEAVNAQKSEPHATIDQVGGW